MSSWWKLGVFRGKRWKTTYK